MVPTGRQAANVERRPGASQLQGLLFGNSNQNRKARKKLFFIKKSGVKFISGNQKKKSTEVW